MPAAPGWHGQLRWDWGLAPCLRSSQAPDVPTSSRGKTGALGLTRGSLAAGTTSSPKQCGIAWPRGWCRGHEAGRGGSVHTGQNPAPRGTSVLGRRPSAGTGVAAMVDPEPDRPHPAGGAAWGKVAARLVTVSWQGHTPGPWAQHTPWMPIGAGTWAPGSLGSTARV